MIGLGAELIEQSQAVLLGFAGILLFSSYKLLAAGGDNEEEDEDLGDNFIVKLCRLAHSLSTYSIHPSFPFNPHLHASLTCSHIHRMCVCL